jgi:hypothetical protein
MMSGKRLLETWAPALPVLVLIGFAALVYPIIRLLLAFLVLFGLPIGAWCWVTVVLYSTREDWIWKAKDWLPLRGRWLCYLVCSLMLLPVLCFFFILGVLILIITAVLLTNH